MRFSALLFFTILATLAYIAIAKSTATTVTSSIFHADVTATPIYHMNGLPASIFPVSTGYPDEYESTTESDDGVLYLSEQDADNRSLHVMHYFHFVMSRSILNAQWGSQILRWTCFNPR
ncbi:hypothetical protein BD408DRAFT_79765 [Parasitella parasitica]|nr:hypothetical protein BD408DRAFT_79765 [Parasitella parasitica]